MDKIDINMISARIDDIRRAEECLKGFIIETDKALLRFNEGSAIKFINLLIAAMIEFPEPYFHPIDPKAPAMQELINETSNGNHCNETHNAAFLASQRWKTL